MTGLQEVYGCNLGTSNKMRSSGQGPRCAAGKQQSGSGAVCPLALDCVGWLGNGQKEHWLGIVGAFEGADLPALASPASKSRCQVKPLPSLGKPHHFALG